MAIFTAGYGDTFSHQVSDARGQNQILTQWSAQVLRLGMDALVFPRFLSGPPADTQMGARAGDTFRIPGLHWNTSTPATTALASGTVISIRTQGTFNVYGTLDEYGDGMGYENLLDYYIKYDGGAGIIETLANNRARVVNELCRKVIDTTTHIVIVGVTGTTGTTRFDLSSTSGVATTAAGTLDSTHCKNIHDHLKGARVPTFAGLFVMVGNAKFLRGLKNENIFETFNIYNQQPGVGINGIVYQLLGNWEGFTFIQTEEGMAGTYGYVIAPEVGVQVYSKPITLYYYPDINMDAGRLNVIKWHMVAGFAATLRDIGTRALKVYSA